MKKEEREAYLAVIELVKAPLCTLCSYSDWVGGDCADSYNECQHPLDRLSWEKWHEEMLEPGVHCWGFRPAAPMSVIADIVGLVLAERYDEWSWRRSESKGFKLFGRRLGEIEPDCSESEAGK